MTDRHRDPKVPARLPAEDLEAGRVELARHGRSVQDLVIACFRALRTNPRPLLALLEAHWPTAKRSGRPKKASQSGQGPHRRAPVVTSVEEDDSVDELVSEPFEDPA